MPEDKIENRKADHLDICISRDVESQAKTTGLEDISFIHRAVPTFKMDEINLESMFLGYRLKYPIIIGAMTGGHVKALEFNRKLGELAEEYGIGMGVGSQRAALNNERLVETYRVAREVAPSSFLIANIGAPQISTLSDSELEKIVNMISANALAIHLNCLQESIQLEGETSFCCFLESLSNITRKLSIPVIVKETGAGICGEDAKKLEEAGVSAIDVSGAGGTSWSAVEYIRGGSELGKIFWDWGIPTAVSLIECINSVRIPLVASGGIRTGVDIAKSLALGACAVSISLPFLRAAAKGMDHLRNYLNSIIKQLKITMYLVGAKTVGDLRKIPLIVTGKTAEWLKLRGFDISQYATRIMK
ncbi:MAG: type 2 isopentenyl-diphosphate Delta-isomerase [Candidatus Odinarchaeum yellowstonii]|uniref:Isopentenyl-diphosphate delta-isomerase n=1 Tax=Odinarchaeota yellowstonii (strain LCB_4) TaxID=1841599 RepID=A0AAF0D132_ODILC|nr:MAG: type 2 isopentenyl-diphosphate Delta-isomerase [Candidatus Odinarchaeum yellowstonii]